MKPLYDAHTYLGHWPFRQLVDNTADTLRAKLEKYNISKALTANLNSVFYKDSQSGNKELAEWIKPHKNFFSGAAVLNPKYAAWERDLEKCVNEFGFKALRLVPQYHNYKVSDADCLAICHKAAQLNIPVLISPSIVDVRQAHWMDTQEFIAIDNILALAQKVAALRVVFSFSRMDETAAQRVIESGVADRIFFNCHLFSVRGQVVAKAIKKLGAGRFLFCSGAPMREITPGILKLELADISDSEREIISRDTFLTLFE